MRAGVQSEVETNRLYACTRVTYLNISYPAGAGQADIVFSTLSRQGEHALYTWRK